MDDHQRRMWLRMIAFLDRYEMGDDAGLGKLTSDLRGLFVEADPHESMVRSEFELLWSSLDGERELRTEPWAPAGSASDEQLRHHLNALRRLVAGVLEADTGTEHT